MNESSEREAQRLLDHLDKLADRLQDYIAEVRLDIEDPSVLEDVYLVRSYGEQLRRAIKTGSSKEALRAGNRARGIGKGLGDRVWIDGCPWFGDFTLEILKSAIRLDNLLIDELGGFDEAYRV